MAPHENVLGLVYTGGETRRPPLVGMEFLHQAPVRAGNIFRRRILRKSQDFIGLILRHRGAEAPALTAPAVRVSVVCRTPAGRPAVEIRFE